MATKPSQTISEYLLERFFAFHGVPCMRVPTVEGRSTPDYRIELAQAVICEVKQIDGNEDDQAELTEFRRLIQSPAKEGRHTKGRWMPNRFDSVFKDVSRQLKRAADAGLPTIVVVYDNTPLKTSSDPLDIIQAMYGRFSVTVWEDEDGQVQHSGTYHGARRRFTPSTNTSVSAVALLAGGSEPSQITVALFHNRFAKVPLNPSLFAKLPVTHNGV